MIPARASSLALGIACGLAALPATANIDIVFNYDYDTFGFFNDGNRRSLLESAASVFEGRITDSLSAIAPSGSNTFQVNFQNPANPSGNIQPADNHYAVAADQIIVYVGGANLTGNSLALGGTGAYNAVGTSQFLNTVRTRGQSGINAANPSLSTDFSLWGGFISFDNDSSWFYDTTLATSNDISGIDFYSVALHEISHVLGFGIAGSWDHWVSGTTFDGPNTPATALTTDTAHWLDGTTSTINGVGSFEAALDPTITPNSRKNLTDLDWNGLRDVGWQVAAVPEPETWAMLLAGLGLVGAVIRRRRG